MSWKTQFEDISAKARESFQRRSRLLSFQEYMDHLIEDPRRHLRTTSQYILDAFEHYGYEEAARIGLKDRRWKLFDAEFDPSIDPLFGQERMQNAVHRQLVQFARRGRSDKMILLHGPNGSSKTTIVTLLMAGLEKFSLQPEGALYRFNWIFAERDERSGRIGFDGPDEDAPVDEESYAYLKPRQISAKIPGDLWDPPIFLIPREQRREFLDDLVANHPRPEELEHLNLDYFYHGNLAPLSKQIYEALLHSYHGDWTQVLKHVQVERFFVSRRYRQGAISIEPQGNIDASVRPLSFEPSVQLPTPLQGLTLLNSSGDLVDANHGIVEYSDFLKRPLEANKYLLTTSEKGTIQLPDYAGYLDLVMLGTANEKHLSLFKRSTDFPSFKGRTELVQVPYLLRFSTEEALYERHIEYFSKGREVAPHTAEVAALWAVLTRLRRPSAKNFSPDLAPLVARLSPIEKALLYDRTQVPLHFKDSERKLLRSAIRKVREELDDAEAEFEGIIGAEYEGRRGASAREMLSLLADAADNRKYQSLTPMAVFEELEKLVKESSIYEFLRIPVDNGYHDCARFIEDVKEYYLDLVVQEVYDSIGLVEEGEYERVFEEYFQHVKAFDLGEKIFVAARNEYREPSEELMGRIESLMTIHEPIEEFRSNLITKIAAWSLDHPDERVQYDDLFPEIYQTLKQSYHRERERALRAIENDILRFGTDDFEMLESEQRDQVVRTIEHMCEKHGYSDSSAKDVIAFVLRHRH